MTGGIKLAHQILLFAFRPEEEYALNADRDQSQQTNPNPGPPRTQCAIELQDGDNRAVDQDTKQGANDIADAAA